MVALVARAGRKLQRYNSHGRLVVGYDAFIIRFKSRDEGIDQGVEALVISSQKGQGMMFPKGGWESDESICQAATREALEEAGVQGELEEMLGKWHYKSKRYGTFYEGYMFPLNVTQEVDYFSEMEVRRKKWVTIAETREGCRDLWMRKALEAFILRLSQERNQCRI